jgi:hypothetical protein
MFPLPSLGKVGHYLFKLRIGKRDKLFNVLAEGMG